MAATSVGNGNATAATTAASGFEADYFNLGDLDFNFELRPVETSLTTSVAADPGNSQRVTRARTREQERPLSPFLAIDLLDYSADPNNISIDTLGTPTVVAAGGKVFGSTGTPNAPEIAPGGQYPTPIDFSFDLTDDLFLTSTFPDPGTYVEPAAARRTTRRSARGATTATTTDVSAAPGGGGTPVDRQMSPFVLLSVRDDYAGDQDPEMAAMEAASLATASAQEAEVAHQLAFLRDTAKLPVSEPKRRGRKASVSDRPSSKRRKKAEKVVENETEEERAERLRKEAHNEVERKRRQLSKMLMEELKELCETMTDPKPSKTQILQGAVDYIKALKLEVVRLRKVAGET